jgi:hypothetical protein
MADGITDGIEVLGTWNNDGTAREVPHFTHRIMAWWAMMLFSCYVIMCLTKYQHVMEKS